MSARNYSNTAQSTTLSGAITNSSTTIVVGGTSGFPVAPFTLVLDPETASEEAVSVTNVAGSNLTVARGQDGTLAVSHDAGAAVIHAHTAQDFQEPQDHINATSDVHGTGPGNAVVGTGSAQVLTNKDLTSATNTLPSTVVKTTNAQVLTNKDLTSLTNDFPQSYTPQPGDIKMTAEPVSSSPTVVHGGWLKCDGGAVSRATFADLFASIGTTYGPGDGSTTFNLPDLRGRFPIGAGTFAALSDDDGVAEASRTPRHLHNISSGGGHTHTIQNTNHAGLGTTQGGGSLDRVISIGGTLNGQHNHGGNTGSDGSHDHGGDTALNSGTSIPYLAVHFLIKT